MADERGVKSTDKGTVIPVEKRLPYNKELLHVSKSEFKEIERKRKEKELKLKEISAQIDKEHEVKKEEKKKPKKIE